MQVGSICLADVLNVCDGKKKYRFEVRSRYLKEQDPSIQGYIKFPATLMIKCTREKKYSLENEFWTIVNSSKLVSFFY